MDIWKIDILSVKGLHIDTHVCLEIIAKFYWFLILQSDRKFHVVKTIASGKSHGMRTVCKLS